MNDVAVATDKRRRIEFLWEKLRVVKIGTPEYQTLVHEIGILAMEYHAINDPLALGINNWCSI